MRTLSLFQEVEEPLQDQVVMGRSRVLKYLGGALFGVAVSVFVPGTANAAIPAGCFGWNRCPTCYGSSCTGGCVSYSGACPSGQSCWWGCSNSKKVRCCDCYCPGPGIYCICPGYSTSPC